MPDRTQPLMPLSVHQMFLLLAIEFGFSTSYDFLSRLALSVNSSGPRLREMEGRGLVECALGPRRKSRYSLTAAGRDVLKSSLAYYQTRHWSFDRGLTFENLPLAIITAWFYSGPDGALQCLEEAQSQIRARAKKKKAEAENLREALARLQSDSERNEFPVDGAALLSATFALIRAELAAGELEYQSDSLPAIKQIIRNIPPPSAVAGVNFEYFAESLKPVFVRGGS